jgi:hypothetical protein
MPVLEIDAGGIGCAFVVGGRRVRRRLRRDQAASRAGSTQRRSERRTIGNVRMP